MIKAVIKHTQDGKFINVYECVTEENGEKKVYWVPDDMGNRYRVMIKEWLDDGNTLTPYVAPEVPYQDKRVKAYGSIGDQLDMQYRDLVNGTTEWKDHIAKVKSDIAKE